MYQPLFEVPSLGMSLLLDEDKWSLVPEPITVNVGGRAPDVNLPHIVKI